MLIDYQKLENIYIVCGKTDLRQGIDGLANLIQNHYQLELYQSAVFLFCFDIILSNGYKNNNILCDLFAFLSSLQYNKTMLI